MLPKLSHNLPMQIIQEGPRHRSRQQMGILTHELSHAILSTRDLEYFFNPCKFLAFKAPHEAINNANNFEYFVETL